ncbi:ABC transporter protein [Pedobacter sp. BAL39]|uniref:ABC transporter ATP-binding protein n=1 Tax=Pedobacter sp. BAL39 TaxID=391596 RepID=UPI000155AC75|nr:ATP-binding cassette domain-containing protein [Pedobacter sp. BAL39]EDM33890.1 ABC transporter protein [Pedobacter sp. BAL39]
MTLEFKDFRKGYNGRPVISIDGLKLNERLYWLRGENGSGKSTLLKAVAGILHFEGDVVLNDQYSLKRNTRGYRCRVNFAEAEPLFPAFLTGMDLVALFTEVKHGKKGAADEYIERMHMQEYINDAVGTYSSGMTKKLSLILSFIGEPELILLDEPLITLDAAALEVLSQWITEKSQRDQVSFFLASHQQLSDVLLPAVEELFIEHKGITSICQ